MSVDQPARQYRDFIVDAVVSADARYDDEGRPDAFDLRVLDSPVGEGEESERVPVPDWDALEECRDRLALGILPESDAAGYARLLGALILPPNARAMFDRSLSLLGDEPLRIRLRLFPALSALPFECALVQFHDEALTKNDYLVFHVRPKLSIVRHERIAVPANRFREGEKRTVLVAMASPAGQPPLNLPEEQRRIKEALGRQPGLQAVYVPDFGLPAEEGVHVPGPAAEAGATRAALEQALRETGPIDFFHFSGHGGFDDAPGPARAVDAGRGVILLAKAGDEADEVPAQDLCELLADARVGLAVLNACESGRSDRIRRWSGIAQALQAASVPVVVAMQFAVRDDLAQAFAGAFYTALVAGETPDEAVRQGRNAIYGRDSTSRDWVAPVLYLRNDGGAPLPPVQDPAGRAAAAEAVAHRSTLIDVLGNWLRERGTAGLEQLESIEKAAGTLDLMPLDYLLLLRSAVYYERDTSGWMRRLADDKEIDWLTRGSPAGRRSRAAGEAAAGGQAPEAPPSEEDRLLGLAAMPANRDERLEAIAHSAALNPDSLTRRTAALALLAVAPDRAASLLQAELLRMAPGTARRRAAELFGLLADADPDVARKLGRLFGDPVDRLAIWGWRVRRRLSLRMRQFVPWGFSGALGAALAWGAYRGLLAVPAAADQPGTAFAVHSYWGFLFGLALAAAALLAGPLALDDLRCPGDARPAAAAVWTAALGALGFGLAHLLTAVLNGQAAALALRGAPPALLAGLGPALALVGQPYAGRRLGFAGWLLRLLPAFGLPALAQLPALHAALLPQFREWRAFAGLLSAPVIVLNYGHIPWLSALFGGSDPSVALSCCYGCTAAAQAGWAAHLWGVLRAAAAGTGPAGCAPQLLSVLNAGLTGLLLAAGIIAGMHAREARK